MLRISVPELGAEAEDLKWAFGGPSPLFGRRGFPGTGGGVGTPPSNPLHITARWKQSFGTPALPLPSTTLAGGFQEEPGVQGRKLQHQGKASDGSLGPRKFPAFKTVRNVEFKLNVATFGGDGREKVKVIMPVSKGMGVANNPVDPGGNFPSEAAPNFTKANGKGRVAVSGLD